MYSYLWDTTLVRVGLLWIRHDGSYLNVPAMMLFRSHRSWLAECSG